MSEELKPVRCGCGGEARVLPYRPLTAGLRDLRVYHYIECDKCGTRTIVKTTEAEAIEAWNRRAERTAKVVEHEYRIGTSLNIVGEPRKCHEYLCGACKKKVLGGDDYCSHCGAKLDWVGR